MSIAESTPRQTEYPVAAQFTDRWSPRSFADQPVSKDEVLSLLEAARWAPSASNNQPARFVWALQGEAGFAAINSGLVPFNQSWAGKAAALIVVASKDTTIGRDGAEAKNPWATFDAGAAWMSLALQAHAMGLVAHAMAGFDAATLATALSLPEGHTLHAVVAIGHRGPVEVLPEALQAREAPSPRNPLAASAFHGRF
jgi:nitroreductase